MNHEEPKIWAVRGEDTVTENSRSAMAVGRGEMGDLSRFPDKAALKEQYDALYPEETAAERTTGAGLLYRLAREIRTGDYVASLQGPVILLGKVTGDYAFDPQSTGKEHRREIQWQRTLPLEEFSKDAQREISGSPLRLFPLKRNDAAYLSQLGVTVRRPERTAVPALSSISAAQPAGQGAAVTPVRSAGSVDAVRYILEIWERRMGHLEMRDFTTGLLRAMGYETEFAREGTGVDLSAWRDELSPRLVVMVRQGEGREADVDQLKRMLEPGQFGLLVAVSGFSPEIHMTLDAAPRIRGIAGKDLARLVLKYYDKLEEKYRRMVPLRMTYVPIA